MPDRAANRPIDLRDLETCETVPDIAALLRKLRYPIEPDPVAVPLDDGELPGALRDHVAARYPLADLTGAETEPLAVTLFVLRTGPLQAAALRGISQQWPRRFVGMHLLIFAAYDPEPAMPVPPTGAAREPAGVRTITFVNARRVGEGAQVRIKLHKLSVDRARPTRHDLETLCAIAVAPGASPTQVYQAQCAAFDVERITENFYRGYKRLFDAAKARIKAENPGIAAFYDDARLHTFTQRLFGRLMFLYFLQKKGALNGEQEFITKWYTESMIQHENYYRFVLEPLFFQTLNLPRDGNRSLLFGRVPYLNGGLFAPDADDHVGQVFLHDDLFAPKDTSGLLYFLNNHNFTVAEDTPLEVEVALDPEMLGKVFENLLEADERGKSGTFYTPRPVVAFMCREALGAYLARATGLDEQRLGWLLDEAESGAAVRDDAGHERLVPRTLAGALRQQLERALVQARVLDPAVGSGAFPLGMLALLVGVRRALYRVGEAQIAPHAAVVQDWKRAFIRDCLYGVDIKREAVEIARLRLWLALVVDADPFAMDPLPNLDYKLMAGDSLIETFDGVAIYPTRPAAGPVQATLGEDGVQARIRQLHELQADYFQPAQAGQRQTLQAAIHATEYALVDDRLTQREEQLRARYQLIERQLTLLQGRQETKAQRAELAAIVHEQGIIAATRADLRAGQPLPFFLFRLHFAPVFAEKNGFDIVIANPPYVSIETIKEKQTKDTLKETYPEVAAGRGDLYTFFYARGLQLLHEYGTLAFVTSNKFFRANYGKGLLSLLQKSTSVRMIIDFGDAPVFDAAAYPCIVVADKGEPAPDHTFSGMTATGIISDVKDLEKIRPLMAIYNKLTLQHKSIQPPTTIDGATILVEKLLQYGIPLSEYVGNKSYRGVVTGLNNAFVVSSETRNYLIEEDPQNIEVLKPYLRGRDVTRYSLNSAGLWLIYTYHGIDIDDYPSIKAYLLPFKAELEKRATKQPWYELQQPQFAFKTAFESPKIVSVKFGIQAGFAFDSSGFYSNNATSFVYPGTKWLTALLNSSICNICLINLCPSVQNGYSQFFNYNIDVLPIVEPTPADQAQLAELVDSLQAIGGQGAKAAELERAVDAIVYRTYGLTAEEIAAIEGWHAGRRATVGRGKAARANGQAATATEDAQQ